MPEHRHADEEACRVRVAQELELRRREKWQSEADTSERLRVICAELRAERTAPSHKLQRLNDACKRSK